MVSEFRASTETKTIPIILMSAVNFRNPLAEDDPEESLNVDGYIVKPVKPESLLEEVWKTLASPDKT